jgi:polyhydroxyalkanoate synthase subunit PhaC
MEHLHKVAKINGLLVNPPEIKTGQTPFDIAYRKHKVKLIHYRAPEKIYETPLLITYAMVNKPYILDLLPGRSIIQVLLSRGFNVFLIDWGTPTESDSNKGLDVYIDTYMNAMVDKTLEIAGVRKLSLLGYCMGGTFSLIYAALNRNKIKNLILMATPFDCSINDGLLFQWAKDFPVEEIAETYGNCPGWLLAASFLALNPMNALDKAVSLYKGVNDDSFVELFMAMEKWINDTVPVPGKTYTEFMRWCYQENRLFKNEFHLAGKKADLGNITCPFLNLVAEEDTSVPPSSSTPIAEHLASTEKEMLTCKVGHIGLAVSGKALKTLWPKATEWIAARSGKLIDTV